MSGLTAGEVREAVRIVFLCIFWYAVSSSNGVIGKWILSEFPYPMTLTMAQLASIAIYSGPMLALLGVRKASSCSSFTWKYYGTMILPLAFAKFASSVLAHVSIWKVPVSYAHTVKATLPFFTVIMSRILLGERYSWRVYLSLLPIIVGVGIATVTEVSFDLTGLSSALMATGGFSVISIFSKKVLKETGVHHLRLLCTLGRIACLMFFPVWLLMDFSRVAADLTNENSISSGVIFLLVIDGVLHWMQNILAFTIIKLVAPLTYAVANVTKRISIISVSLLLIQNHVTSSNICGMMLAIGGVFYYNKVKYEENKYKTTLPTSHYKKPQKPQNPLLWNANTTNNVKFVSPIKTNDYTNSHGGASFDTFSSSSNSSYTNNNAYHPNGYNPVFTSSKGYSNGGVNSSPYMMYPTRSPSS